MKKLFVVLLLSCDSKPSDRVLNQCIRAELFQQCMKTLPRPQYVEDTKNHRDTIVECGRQAFFMAIRTRSATPLECVSEYQ